MASLSIMAWYVGLTPFPYESVEQLFMYVCLSCRGRWHGKKAEGDFLECLFFFFFFCCLDWWAGIDKVQKQLQLSSSTQFVTLVRA